ncbi:MAG: sulfatase-like hydrolase/transferase [Verrucomicrobia bacterium]|nr:sulfatase-like hydrolase/transferase [Verrucomicrobiota bacterium]
MFPLQVRSSPNILFIFSDDHRYDLLGSIDPEIHTPNLDALASSGVRFDTAIATTAICSPARAAVLTGRYGSQNGVMGLAASIHNSEVTFADYLKGAGYRTAQFGKWHIGNTPASVGFDTYARIYGNGSWFNRSIDSNIPGMPTDLGGTFYEEFMANRVIEYVSNHVATATAEPFVLWWCNQVAHVDGSYNYPASTVSLDLHAVEDMPVPGNWADDLADKPPHLATSRYITQSVSQDYGGPGGYSNMDPGVRNTYMGQDNVQQHNKEYYSAVTDLDREIGRVLDALEDPNGDGNTSDSIVDNTWVIFLGDNGWQTGSHKFTSKVLSYEESMRVPMIIRAPGLASRVETNLVLNIDVTQLMLDVAGVAIPDNMPGRNLRTLLENPSAPWRDRVLYEALSSDLGNKPHRTIRTGRYKYIQTHGLVPQFEELYDLATDPLELTNLASDPAYAAIKAGLVQALEEEMAAIPSGGSGLNTPWSGLDNPGFEASPFDSGWSNPGVAMQTNGIVEGSSQAALVGGSGTGRLSQPLPGLADFTLAFSVHPSTGPVSDRMWNMVLHQNGGDGSDPLGAFLNIKGTIDGALQIYNGSSWVDVAGGVGAFAIGQTTLMQIRARDLDAGSAEYDLFWSLPGGSNLSQSAIGLSAFQSTPGTTGATGLNFARTSSLYGTYVVDEVRLEALDPFALRNGDFEREPFLEWWYWNGVEQVANLSPSSSSSAAKFPYNVPSEIWQTLCSRRTFTLSVLFELAGVVNESLHVEINNDSFVLEDLSAGKMLEIRIAPGGELEVKAGGAWLKVLDSTHSAPTRLLAETPYELEIIGRDFGLPGASWDLAWSAVLNPSDSGSATDLRVFSNLENATTGAGAATVRFFQKGIPPANSYVLDDVSFTTSMVAVAVDDHGIAGIESPGKGFLSWMASKGYDPFLGFGTLSLVSPAEDGIGAFAKYVLGLPLMEASDYSGRIVLYPCSNTVGVIMNQSDPDVWVAIQTSEDLLGDWATQPPSTEIPAGQDGVDIGLVRRQYQLPSPAGNALFVRVLLDTL